MIADTNTTINMWKTFNLKYRALFPKEWTIRLYALAFFRAEVIPDMGKPLSFVLRLGHDKKFYELAAKSFKEQVAGDGSDGDGDNSHTD